MPFSRIAVATAALAAVAGPASTQPPTRTTGPVATYWMTAQTSVGMPAMGAGASPLAMMSAMAGGGGAQQSLLLQLGSTRAPEGRAQAADHMPPAGLGVGSALSLAIKTAARAGDSPIDEMPTGAPRVLIYFGCGTETRARQPINVRLDMEGGRQLAAIMAAHHLQRATPPSPSNSRTYAEWPTGRGRVQSPTGSLVGAHLVKSDYAPDIRFNLNASQDFLAPLQLTGVSGTGPVQLGWNSVPNARGYFATTIGQNEAGDLVVWTSSETAAFPMHVPDLLSPSELTRLQAAKTILPASATSCAVPSAVTKAAPESMLRVVAFGGETNIVWPPRPADRNAVWNIESVVKVRYNSTAGVVLGMDAAEADEAPAASALDLLPGGPAARALGSAFGRLRKR